MYTYVEKCTEGKENEYERGREGEREREREGVTVEASETALGRRTGGGKQNRIY